MFFSYIYLGPDNFLLYADINKIQLLSLDKDLSTEPITLFYGDGQSNIESVAYDESKERLYWADRHRYGNIRPMLQFTEICLYIFLI
jgi:hypothetical protein